MNDGRKDLTPIRLTPASSIFALEERFKLGEKMHPEDCWDATKNQEQLDNQDWITDRIAHARQHMDHFISVQCGWAPDDGDDDGAAIMWLGCMLHEAWERRKKLNGSKPR